MTITLLVHVAAGAVGIVSGFVALYSPKGGRVHRGGGRVFVYAMFAMASIGAGIAAVRGGEASTIAGVLTAYLVVTGATAVRPPSDASRRLHAAGTAVALAVGVASAALGVEAAANGGVREGIPAVVLFKFGVAALLAFAGDVRVLRSGARRGQARLARHLWRMCFALYVAAASFFFGQADELPAALRVPALLAAPVVAVVVTMLYWLWRVRARRGTRGVGRAARAA